MKYISINPIKHTRTIPATLGFIVNNKHGYATISTTPYNSDILGLIIFTDENAKYTITRMKGLGEMDADELRDTTMSKEFRILRKITVDDAMGADEIFTTLMGEDVEPRRKFIEENAIYVSNLDI